MQDHPNQSIIETYYLLTTGQDETKLSPTKTIGNVKLAKMYSPETPESKIDKDWIK